ncbi:MAG: diguanylate cyclase [Bacilli bacterium]|nr:diguanylate cyclase [Bacilli bacterium]
MKKKGVIALILVVLVLFSAWIIFFFVKEDKETSLTAAQRRWIENNKNKVIDLSVLSDIPIINSNGNGLLFDFLSSLEKDTGLEFNKLSYTKGSKATSEYALVATNDYGNDILFYKDNYVIATKKKFHFSNVSELSNLNIGVLKSDVDKVKDYLSGSNLTYSFFDNEDALIEATKLDNIDGIILPKVTSLNKIISNKLNIAYNISEYSINYVLKLGSNKKLNKILSKYFNNYKNLKYDTSFNKHLTNTYFTLNNIEEKEQTNFRSKRYSYGFVNKAPYDVFVSGSLKGYDYSLLNGFAEAANIDIDYKRYSSNKTMANDFNSNKLDIISSDVGISKFDMDVYETVSFYDNKVYIVSKGNSDLFVNNISSLNDSLVYVVTNSKIHKTLSDNNIKCKAFDDVDSLISHLNGNNIAAVDSYTYDYYVRKNADLKKLGQIDLNIDYGFIGRDISSNKTFNNYFNFYLSFINSGIINESYDEILVSNNSIKYLKIALGILIGILIISFIFLVIKFLKKRKKYDFKLSKADKLRYIDSLTSLKNRNYLNDNIGKWDSSEVYPQSVLIVDLNNIAYINDNFGHAEGDKVIVEGAGVLINNQLSDSEIIRTNGNEFLIFTIGHDEKDIITYIRKLNKEFKELSHGFGAAIGYSMINDEIKTIDDAINEATSDMRNNKEEAS